MKQNIIIALLVIGALGYLFEIWVTFQDDKHCAEFAKSMQASRADHVGKLGCVAVMPDGRVVAEPKQ